MQQSQGVTIVKTMWNFMSVYFTNQHWNVFMVEYITSLMFTMCMTSLSLCFQSRSIITILVTCVALLFLLFILSCITLLCLYLLVCKYIFTSLLHVKHFDLHFLYERCYTNKVYYYYYYYYYNMITSSCLSSTGAPVILAYLNEKNRPYSAQDVFCNLQKQHGLGKTVSSEYIRKRQWWVCVCVC